jgi:hypothetical protein
MLRCLATVFACVVFTFVPFALKSVPRDEAPSIKLAAKSPAIVEVKRGDAAPRDKLQEMQPGPLSRLTEIASSFDWEIGAASDAHLRSENKGEPRLPLSREAVCQVIHEVAAENNLPVPLFTRLIWQESRFRHDVVSPAGARGIAQFMPATAAERGLEDPFDPLQALPASADFLRELMAQFGNFGLAAAAYNGGPGRVSRWLKGTNELPRETREYVARITGRSAEQWAEQDAQARAHSDALNVSRCEVRPMRAALELLKQPRTEPAPVAAREESPVPSPIRSLWMAVLTSNWSGAQARKTYEKLQKKYPKVLAHREPKIIVAKKRGKGTASRTTVGVPAQTRAEAADVCKRIKEEGESCVIRKDPA